MANSVIKPGEPGHKALLAMYEASKGGDIVFAGATWKAVQDNDQVIFVSTGSVGTLDKFYGSHSFASQELAVPMKPAEEATEPTGDDAPKPKRKK